MELTLAKAWYGLLANVPRTSAHVTGVASIGRMNTGVSLPGANVAYAVRYAIDAEASETLNVMAEGGTTDHEGNATPPLASVHGILIEVASGTGTITGTAADSITYAAGQVITLIRPGGITTDLTDTLTITAATETDITISVVGAAVISPAALTLAGDYITLGGDYLTLAA